jgi:hypothetical protein
MTGETTGRAVPGGRSQRRGKHPQPQALASQFASDCEGLTSPPSDTQDVQISAQPVSAMKGIRGLAEAISEWAGGGDAG